MRHKFIPPISSEELQKLSTRQLLARLKRLHQCEAAAVLSDVGEQPSPPGVLFKNTAEWTAAYEQVKAMLAQREHISRGTELVENRKQRAKLARTIERRSERQKRR